MRELVAYIRVTRPGSGAPNKELPMKILLATAAAIALLAGASAASAETYGSIGYSKIDLSDVDLGAVTARVGANINSWFGVEGEVSVGVQDESVTIPVGQPGAGTYAIELKHSVAVFAVARAPVAEGFSVFGRVGYATSKFEATIPGTNVSGSAEGVAYGVGAQYDFGVNGVRADFTRYDVEFDDADAYTISYVRKF